MSLAAQSGQSVVFVAIITTVVQSSDSHAIDSCGSCVTAFDFSPQALSAAQTLSENLRTTAVCHRNSLPCTTASMWLHFLASKQAKESTTSCNKLLWNLMLHDGMVIGLDGFERFIVDVFMNA